MIFDDYEWAADRPPECRPKAAIDLFLEVLQNDVRVLYKGYQVIVKKSEGDSPPVNFTKNG